MRQILNNYRIQEIKLSISRRWWHALERGTSMAVFSVATQSVHKTSRDSCVHISVFHLLHAPVPLLPVIQVSQEDQQSRKGHRLERLCWFLCATGEIKQLPPWLCFLVQPSLSPYLFSLCPRFLFEHSHLFTPSESLIIGVLLQAQGARPCVNPVWQPINPCHSFSGVAVSVKNEEEEEVVVCRGHGFGCSLVDGNASYPCQCA